MYKATQDARHLQRREGSFSTVPSARGVNLLGWEEPENLTPAEQRKALGRRVGQIQAFLAAHKDLTSKDRWKLIREMNGLVDRVRALKPGARVAVRDLPLHFIDVARERLTLAEFHVWLNEARDRARTAGVSAPSRCSRCGRYEDGSRQCPNGDPACPVTTPGVAASRLPWDAQPGCHSCGRAVGAPCTDPEGCQNPPAPRGVALGDGGQKNG